MAKALCLLYTVWGMNWVVMRLANNYFSPAMFVTYRFGVGALVLLMVAAYCRLPLPDRRFWPWIAVTGILQIALNNIIVQICITPLGSGLSAVINYTMPIWVAILAQFFLGEKLSLRKIGGILLSLGGLCILLKADVSGDIGPMLLALFGAFLWAAANIIYKKKLTECNVTAYNTWQMTVGALALMTISVSTGQDLGIWTWESVACVAYNGVLASALAFFLWSYILKHMEAGKASVSILAVPVVGVLGGAALLGEPLTASSVGGMALILGGILLVVRQSAEG